MLEKYGDFLDVSEAAPELHKSAWSIRDLCRKGVLPSFKIGGRILIQKRELIKHIENQIKEGAAQ